MNSGYIIEDHPSAQQWLKEALQIAYPQMTIRVASNLEEGHALLKGGAPQIALVDLNLPDGSGIELIGRLQRESSDTYTVVATIYDDDDHLFPALRAGARGYILKEQRKEEISALLQGIVNGAPPLSPAISQRMISYFAGQKVDKSPAAALTEREQQVLTIIATGCTLSDAAIRLGVTRNTVASQVKSIYSKLNISSRAEAAVMAAKIGILETH